MISALITIVEWNKGQWVFKYIGLVFLLSLFCFEIYGLHIGLAEEMPNAAMLQSFEELQNLQKELNKKLSAVEIIITSQETGAVINDADVRVLRDDSLRILSHYQEGIPVLPQTDGRFIYHPRKPGEIELCAYKKGCFCQAWKVLVQEVSSESIIETSIQLKPTKTRLFAHYKVPEKMNSKPESALMAIAGDTMYPLQLEKIKDSELDFEVFGFPEGRVYLLPKVIYQKELKTFITFLEPCSIVDGTTKTMDFNLFVYDAVPFRCIMANHEPIPENIRFEVEDESGDIRRTLTLPVHEKYPDIVGAYIPVGQHSIRIAVPGYKLIKKDIFVDPKKILVRLEPEPVLFEKE